MKCDREAELDKQVAIHAKLDPGRSAASIGHIGVAEGMSNLIVSVSWMDKRCFSTGCSGGFKVRRRRVSNLKGGAKSYFTRGWSLGVEVGCRVPCSVASSGAWHCPLRSPVGVEWVSGLLIHKRVAVVARAFQCEPLPLVRESLNLGVLGRWRGHRIWIVKSSNCDDASTSKRCHPHGGRSLPHRVAKLMPMAAFLPPPRPR